MKFGWYPRDHRSALEGMMGLTLEERGAYNTLLDLIYDRQGPIPDEDRWIAGWLQCSVRKWRLIRASLIVKGKLYEINVNATACLMNEKAAFVIESQSARSRVSVESGASGGRKRAENEVERKQNNDLAAQTLKPPSSYREGEGDKGSVSAPKGSDTGADAPDGPLDRNKEAWREAVELLSPGDGRHGEARKLFGRILKIAGCQAADMLVPIYEAQTNGTQDPAAYLTAAAKRMAARRKPGQPLPVRQQAHWC